MIRDIKRVFNDIEFDSSSIKRVRSHVTCLLDLPDEILLLICHYLSSYDILYSFYTLSKPKERFHRIIFDYYKTIKLDQIRIYFSELFSHSKTPLRPESLIISNEYVTCLIYYYFTYISPDVIQSMFNNLIQLTLINCSTGDLEYLNKYIHVKQLEYLHITIRGPDADEDMDCLEMCNTSINQLLFNGKMSSIRTIDYQIYNGLLLNKSLIPHNNLRNINLLLETIVDLYILLNGLVPNVQIMFIKLYRQRKPSYYHSPSALSTCPQLTEFTLFESSIVFVIDDIKSILTHMINLIKLTLSIHDTLDDRFCSGPTFESILNEYVPHLRQFHYTMTHQINTQILIKDFIRWPMNVTYYGREDAKWIHIYSLPWPSNKNDKRELPVVRVGFNLPVSSDVKTSEYMKHIIITKQEEFTRLNTQFHRVCQITTHLSFDIKLPLRIYKLVLTKGTPIYPVNLVIQPSIHHLIVKRCLKDVIEMLILARQFPSVQYLELIFSLNECSFINCLNILFNRDDNIEKKNCSWSELVHFSTELYSVHKSIIEKENQLYKWLSQHTDLKYKKDLLDSRYSFSTLNFWF